MKVLVVGSGGREHAICRAVAKSSRVDKIYCAPGNAGIAALAECVPIGAMEFDKLVSFAKDNAIDFTIIGMDDPLVGGIVDEFEKAGLKCFGPKKNAAILEGSKAFSKDLMKKYNIPTAAYENFTDAKEALKYLETAKFPIVLKADGLALGKGVLICNTLEEAKEGVRTIMEDKKFGTAGNTMVVEEFMTGREVSVLSFVDGKTIKIMSSAQDHKRAGDGDTGLNTGGMGNFSPSPFYTDEVDDFCKKYIYQATVDAMAKEGREFHSDAPNPVSLAQILGHEVDRDEVLQKIIEAFKKYYELLRRADYMDVSGIYHLSLYRRKGFHRYEDADGEFEGAFVEVEDDGHLILHDKKGMIRSYAVGEIRFLVNS